MPPVHKNQRLITALRKASTEERRKRQFLILKAWDAGRLTALECIEKILEVESIIYLGDNIRVAKGRKNDRQIQGP